MSNVLKRDSSGLKGQYVGLAPKGVETIAADTDIDYIAITVQDLVNVHFGGTKFSVPAQTTIMCNTGMQLDASTVCLVY